MISYKVLRFHQRHRVSLKKKTKVDYIMGTASFSALCVTKHYLAQLNEGGESTVT